jgi:methylmalonyl-CoA mutase
MTDLSQSKNLVYKAKHKIRFVTAASLFDGHDASINIMRRILQASGAEVIHLGHNRSVEDVVTTALEEDVQGIAISSYQGGHIEYFKYMVDQLRARGGARIQVFGGGGGVIVASEIEELHAYGVARIYSPEDGQKMGLQGMINDMLARCDFDPVADEEVALKPGDFRSLARVITALELNSLDEKRKQEILGRAKASSAPVLGITGTGGAGKSSLTDELVRRFRIDQGDRLKIAILSVDPTRRKTGGALLGDRIRMNADPRAAGFHALARHARLGRRNCRPACRRRSPPAVPAGFDLVIVETSGIGQGEAAIVPLVRCLALRDDARVRLPPASSRRSTCWTLPISSAINKFDRPAAPKTRCATCASRCSAIRTLFDLVA